MAKPTNKKVYILLLLSIALMMSIASAIFLQGIKNLLLLESKNKLTEIAQQCAITVENKISGRLNILTALAHLERIKDPHIPTETKLNLMKQEAERTRFILIGMSDTKGNAITSDGQNFYIGDCDYFLKSMQDSPSVSSNSQNRIGHSKNTIVLCVPIKNSQNAIIGTIFATDHVSRVVSLIDNIYAGPEKNAFLLERDGRIIAENGQMATVLPNFLDRIASATHPSDYALIEKFLGENLSGAGTYKINNTSEIIGISTVKSTENWNVAVTAPQHIITQQASKIMTITALLVAVLMLFVTGSFIYFYSLNKKYVKEKITAQLAAEKLRIKDSFITNVSHEIRTPMHAITGMTYFLKNTTLSPLQKEYLLKIESASSVLLAIINDILDISKFSNGKLRLNNQGFYLSEVTSIIDDIFSIQIKMKGLDWKSTHPALNEILLIGDKQRLIQIIINLVNNAYKFTDAGGVYFIVTQQAEDEHWITYLFSVEDTGIGIAKEDIAKLFIPFEQLESSLNKVYEGTGLGLSICHNLIEAMGGELCVTSTKGQGSTFSFMLSFEKSCEESPAQSPEIPQHAVCCEKKHILLAEDSEINAEITGMLLETLALSYDWAENGQRALDLCRAAPPDYYDLILMDIHMPILNGYDAAQKIRHETHQKAPIIAITATIIDNDLIDSTKSCIDAYILKPFDTELFKQTIYKYLSLKP